MKWYAGQNLPRTHAKPSFSEAWFHSNYGLTFGERYCFDPVFRTEQDRDSMRLLYDRIGQAGIVEEDPQPRPHLEICGHRFVSALFGCEVVYQDDQAPTCRHIPVTSAADITAIPKPDWETNRWVKEFQRQGALLLRRYGFTDAANNYGGPLNAASTILGNAALLYLAESRDIMGRFLDAIAVVCVQSYDRLTVEFDPKAPASREMFIGNCPVMMISPRTYCERVLPADLRLRERVQKFGLHLCGPMDRYLQAYKELEPFEYIEVGWGSNVTAVRQAFPHTTFNLMINIYDLQNMARSAMRELIANMLQQAGLLSYLRDVWVADMERWATAIKGFHLSVPFFERAFHIVRPGGRLGFIVSNAFTKREFGKKLVEDFLPQYTLEEVVDCSGLMFPGHGTPTCIVFARATKPDGALGLSPPGVGAGLVPTQDARQPGTVQEDAALKGGATSGTVRVAATLKGDLRTPPEESPLWESTVLHHAQPGFRDEWVSVTARPRTELSRHPWILSDIAQGTLAALQEVPGTRLETLCTEPIDAQFITGADNAYVLPPHLARRSRVSRDYLRLYAAGEDVRDWMAWPSAVILFPYDESLDPLSEPLPAALREFLTPYRDHLENLIISGTTPKKDTHLKWFEYRRLARAKLRVGLNVIFPQVSMYNHAYLSSHSIAFKERRRRLPSGTACRPTCGPL